MSLFSQKAIFLGKDYFLKLIHFPAFNIFCRIAARPPKARGASSGLAAIPPPPLLLLLTTMKK